MCREDDLFLRPEAVAGLTDALSDDCLKAEAATALRAPLPEIRLNPEDGQLVIDLVGEVAAILALGQESKRSQGRTLGANRLSLVEAA